MNDYLVPYEDMSAYYLICDGYDAYNAVTGAKRCGLFDGNDKRKIALQR